MNGTKRIILIRHATTDLAGKLCGQLDPPLNESGLLQARSFSDRLIFEKIDRVYASNLRRAVQTAEAIANPLGLPVLQRENLREISFGDWEGWRWADLRSNFPEETQRWLDQSLDARAPNGESMALFRDRARKALAAISSEAASQITVVVTHLGVIRLALVNLAGVNPEAEMLRRIDYCSAYEFRTDGQAWIFSRQYQC